MKYGKLTNSEDRKMKKIESLTPEQEAKFDYYVQKWIKVGLSCEPIDLEKCKHYARMAYEEADMKCPTEFIVANGPTHAIEILKSRNAVEMGDVFSGFIYGQHEASWLSFYDFVETELGIDCSAIHGLKGVAENCGWWYPAEDFVIFVKRHSEVHLIDGVCHNDTGPAIAYEDGTRIWIINGVRVNEQIVMSPETLTVKQINAESNTEVRSIMIERFGWHRYILESKAKLIDFRDNAVENTKEALYNTKRYGKRLVVTCPTGRIFTLGVHKSVKTCEEAQNWLGNDTGKKFNVIGRT